MTKNTYMRFEATMLFFFLVYFSVLPQGYTVGRLHDCDAEFVNSHWEFAYEGSLPFVCFHINNFPSVAIRSKEDGSLVAWEITYFIGAMGILYVRKSHRGQGIAKFVIYELAKKLANDVFCWVHKSNKTSIELHLKSGFSFADSCTIKKIKRKKF